MNRERYENLNGIRAYACIGIVLMHVLANGYSSNSAMTGYIFEKIIPSFTNFTYLFMLVSAFSMCCGYYERIINNDITVEKFYKRRYERVWPFFAFLCTVEMLIEHNLNAAYEWFADLTLVFGLIPGNGIEVIGVGWFIGTVFVFYLIFPFFIFLLQNKKRAWLAMIVCLILHILCVVRFTDAATRQNIVYSAMFFMAGGLIYIYRRLIVGHSEIEKLSLLCLLGIIAYYYTFDDSTIVLLVIFLLMMIYSIVSPGGMAVLFNSFTVFIGKMSMEIYLSHMFAYRLLEKLNLLHCMENEIFNYMTTCILTVVGAILISTIIKKIQHLICNLEIKKI